MPQQIITPFQKVPNFRDISSTDSKHIKPGLLYRSAAPDDATPVDRSRLSTEIGLKTIIDLRSDTEHHEVSRKNLSKVPPASEAPPALDPPAKPHHATGHGHTEHGDPENPLRVPGVKYEMINFNGSAYSSHLIWQLSYRNIAKLFTWYTLGWRTDAISILGTNVMQKRGLIGLAQDSLEYCQKEVKLVFDILAKEENYPVLVHCTQGKDRTGLVILLVSMLLDVDKNAIEKDYLLSEEGLASDKAQRIKAIAKIGLGEEFAGCPKDWAQKVIETVESKYGGVEKYLEGCKVDVEQQRKIKEILGVEAARR